ncbi:MAG: MFS transporter [Halobacteriales archaeon]|nr:MFS transporter [Halobacteriales archaeon]
MDVVGRVREKLIGQGVSQELGALAVAQSVAAFGGGMTIPLLAPLLAELPDPFFPATFLGLPVTTELQVGILFSVFGITRSILQVPFGRLSDYLGVRRAFLEAGMLLSAFSLYMYSQAGTVTVLLGVRMLQGVALSISTPAMFAIVEAVTVSDTRGGSMGFFSTMRTLGWGMGPIVGGVLTDLFGMIVAFTLGAGLTGISAVMIHFTVPEPSPESVDDAEEPADEEPEIVPNGGAIRSEPSVLWIFSSRDQATTLLGLGLALVTMMMGFSAMVAMENPILERIGGTKAGFGIVFAIATLTRLVVQFPVGIASDNYGRKRFIVLGLLLSAPLTGLMGFAHTLIEFTALRGLLGVSLAGVIAPAYALAADVVDEHRSGEQMGVVTTAFSVGFAFGPILSGLVAFMGFAVPFLLAAAMTVVGAVIVWMMVDDPKFE